MNTYNDVQMKGIEFQRNLYAQSGFSIRPKSKISKIDQLKVIMEAWGLEPNKILSKEALSRPRAHPTRKRDGASWKKTENQQKTN